MHVEIDKYASLNSIIHSWDPRCKIITLTVAMFMIAFISYLPAALAALLISFLVYISSNIPMQFIAKKILLPLVFLIPMFLVLPFSSGGEILISTEYFSIYQDGINISLLIALKSVSVITLFFTIMATSPFTITTNALRVLKIPVKLLYMIMFTYRYIFIYLEDLRKMNTALKLRGFQNKNSMRSFKASSHLAGSLLIRSFEKTDDIYNAMVLRGFSGTMPVLYEFSLQIPDLMKSVVIILIYTFILIAQILLKGT